MEYAVIAYVAGVFTGGIGVYWVLPWILGRPQPLTDRAVSPGTPLDVVELTDDPAVPLRKVG